MVEKRIQKLQKMLNKSKVDVLFVTNPSNVYYLTGFGPLMTKGVQQLDDPEAFVVVTKNSCVLLTDARYSETAKKIKSTDFMLMPGSPHGEGIAKLLLSFKPSVIGFEQASISAADYSTVTRSLGSVKPVDSSGLISEMRSVKDKAEIKLLGEAQRITGEGYLFAMKNLKKGMSEKEVANLLIQFFMKEAEGVSFDPIVAFGKGSAIPHYKTSADVAIGDKGILLIDCGCVYKGYCGDLTRTVYLGKSTPKYDTIYKTVLAAQKTCIDGLRAGMTGRQADALARNILKKNGYEKYFLHSTGHGVGLDIHEQPRLSKTYDGELKNGMVFSVEPGIYITGWGGVRIEDVVALEKGKVWDLTTVPK